MLRRGLPAGLRERLRAEGMDHCSTKTLKELVIQPHGNERAAAAALVLQALDSGLLLSQIQGPPIKRLSLASSSLPNIPSAYSYSRS